MFVYGISHMYSIFSFFHVLIIFVVLRALCHYCANNAIIIVLRSSGPVNTVVTS